MRMVTEQKEKENEQNMKEDKKESKGCACVIF